MLMLGLQGSPRRKGNTDYLLSLFAQEAERLGVETEIIQVDQKKILPCKEYVVCEKKGFCPIKDDMKYEIYPLLRQAEIIVAATPVFFYNTTAQLKALIDRSQTLWARKYKLKLIDPFHKTRRGFLLAVGATRGKNLFQGLNLTVAYFFDAVSAAFAGSLTYRDIEASGDMKKHPSVEEDVRHHAASLLGPLLNRKKVLFVCGKGDGLSQMAAAFTQYHAGEFVEAVDAGLRPAEKIPASVETVMAEAGIDLAFRRPRSLDCVLARTRPDRVVTLGPDDSFPNVAGARTEHWDLPNPAGKSIDFVQNLRNEVRDRVSELIRILNPAGTA